MNRTWNGIGRIQRDILDFCKMVPRDYSYLQQRTKTQLHDYVVPGLLKNELLQLRPDGKFKTTEKGMACLKLMPSQYKRWLKGYEESKNAASQQ